MNKVTLPARVFLVYAHADKKTVYKLFARLTKAGVKVWLDSERLQPGQDWQSEIRNALLNSDLVLVCLSRNFNKQQGYRHEELKLALQKASLLMRDEIFIIPVRLEKCAMPETLRHLQRVDLFETSGYKKLLQTLMQTRQHHNNH